MHAWHLWIVLGLVLIIAEMVTVSFILASFGIAALITALPAAAGLGLNAQLLCFALSLAVTLGVLRPVAQRLLHRPETETRTNHHALIGQIGTVVECVGDMSAPGRVKIGGEEWRAEQISHEGTIPVGTSIQILEVRSATLIVSARA
jgi:membrane protein implicated in regulation of membrane protease activity